MVRYNFSVLQWAGPVMDLENVPEQVWREAERIPKAQIARDLKISQMTVYRALKDGDGSAA